MIVLGLTGPSGAGKGALARAFAAHDIPSLDTDAIYHELLIPPSPCLDTLVEAFGTGILTETGELNRPALAAVVFGEGAAPTLHQTLNRITHRFILDETRARLNQYEKEGKFAVLVDAPLLYESGFDGECHRVIAVVAPRELRLARIMARDSINAEAAEARFRAQKEDTFYTERADFVVCNDGDAEKLHRAAECILAKLREGTP